MGKKELANTLFALHSTYTEDTTYHVWFTSDSSMTQWKLSKNRFFKFIDRNKHNSLVWKPNFFPRRAIPNIFFRITAYAKNTLNQILFHLDNSMTQSKIVYFKFIYLN